MHEYHRGWLRLSFEPDLTPTQTRALLSEVGLPEQIYASGRRALAAIVGDTLAAQLAGPPAPAVAQAIDHALEWAEGADNHLVTLADEAYPAALLETHDPPPLLYVVGEPAFLNRKSLAIVGARSATPGGAETAHAFAQSLAAAGWSIVSGLALGIDAAAHEGALAAGGDQSGGTLAVVATGADLVYPARNRDLAHRIARQGAIVTELPLGSRALRFQFPRRNRLVAGLARGVLVVEAAVHSGSLITARLAGELGREVFAIPGSIHSPLSRGCHALIRQGAKLTETVEDILSELGASGAGLRFAAPATVGAAGDAARSLKKQEQEQAPPGELPDGSLAAEILWALGYDPVHVDDLQRRLGVPMAELQSELLVMELAGKVRRLDGGKLERSR